MNRRKFFTTVGGLAIVAGPAWSADHILNQRAIETTGGTRAKRQVFLDTETTGCWPEDGHRIVEIGAVEVINGELTGRRFQTYLDPRRDVDAGAQKVHGLDREFLTGRPLFENVWNDLKHFIHGSELLVHNAPFDIDFLNFELAGINALPIEQSCVKVTDTLVVARALHRGMRNDLDTLCMRYGVLFSEEPIGSTIHSAEHLAMVYRAMAASVVENNISESERRVKSSRCGQLPMPPELMHPLHFQHTPKTEVYWTD